MGDTNSMWYYADGDAIGTIDDNEYFLLSTTEFLPTANHLSELLDTPKWANPIIPIGFSPC